MTHKAKIIFIQRNEPVLLSWARDVVSFGALIGTALVLNILMDPSGWLNATLGVSWFLWMLGKSQSRINTMTPNEARAWINKTYPEVAPDAS